MPDDNLFPNSPPEAEPEAPTPSVPAASGVSLAEVQGLLQPLQTELQQTRSENAALQERIAAMANRPEPESPAEDFLDTFSNDPRGTLQKEAQSIVDGRLQQLSPLLEQQLTAMSSTLVESQQAAIDREFGPDTWNEHFAPVMELRMKEARKSNPTALIDPNWVKNEVLALKGHKMDTLVELRSNQLKGVEDAKTKEREEMMANFNATGLTGGVNIPPPNTNREATEAEKAYAASRASAGLSTDIEAIRKSKAIGGTLKEYRAANPRGAA